MQISPRRIDGGGKPSRTTANNHHVLSHETTLSDQMTYADRELRFRGRRPGFDCYCVREGRHYTAAAMGVNAANIAAISGGGYFEAGRTTAVPVLRKWD